MKFFKCKKLAKNTLQTQYQNKLHFMRLPIKSTWYEEFDINPKILPKYFYSRGPDDITSLYYSTTLQIFQKFITLPSWFNFQNQITVLSFITITVSLVKLTITNNSKINIFIIEAIIYMIDWIVYYYPLKTVVLKGINQPFTFIFICTF